MPEQKREYILYFYDGKVRRVTGKLSELKKLPVSRIEEAPVSSNPEGSSKMTDQKISPAIVIIGGLGLGLAAALGACALARAAQVGFTLGIVNPPPGSTHWAADFFSEEEGAFISTAPLNLDEAWDCEYNPYGATDLRIRVLDMVNAITVHDAPNLGPIESGRSYIYDCATGQLSEV